MLPKGPIYYRHKTLISPRFRSRNWRDEFGEWPWEALQQRWQAEPTYHVHYYRPSLMTALGGRKEKFGL